MRGKPAPQGRNSKMTVMIFQLEGSDQTVQEGFRTIGTALDNVMAKNVKLIREPNNMLQPASDSDETDGAEATEEDDAPQSPPPRRKPVAERPPEIIQLDLTKGKPPLKEFMQKHEVKGNNRRYLLIAHWLKETLEIEEVSMDHMHTCYRHLDWTSPDRPTQPLRDMKGRRYGWFQKGSRGHYALTHVGENRARAIIKGDQT